MSVPEPVSVSCWGELRHERKVPGALRVLVGGQDAGAIERVDTAWVAQAHGLKPSRPTAHATAEDALRAVLRSSWARKLGARAASDLYWSDRARRIVQRGGAR